MNQSRTTQSSTKKIEQIYWHNMHKEAKLPTKRNEDGGYDLYICSDKKEFILEPGDIVLFPTGLACAFPPEYVGLFRERGSTGSKCMSLRMGVLDSGYRDEIFVGINNTGKRKVVITDNPKPWLEQNMFYNRSNHIIYPYSKAIAQVVFVRLADLESCDKFLTKDEYVKLTSVRGTGKLGESGK